MRTRRTARLLVDWDGVVVATEHAKAWTWLLPALLLRGQLPEREFQAIQAGEDTERVINDLERGVGEELEQVAQFWGLPRAATAERVVEALGLRATPDELSAKRHLVRENVLDCLSKPIPGAKAFLEALRERSEQVVVVTNTVTETVMQQANKFGLPRAAFAFVEATGDPFYRGFSTRCDVKAVGFARACTRLNVLPFDVVAIDDSPSGVASAKAVGIATIAVVPTPADSVAAADLSVHPDLGALATEHALGLLSDQPPSEAMTQLRAVLSRSARP